MALGHLVDACHLSLTVRTDYSASLSGDFNPDQIEVHTHIPRLLGATKDVYDAYKEIESIFRSQIASYAIKTRDDRRSKIHPPEVHHNRGVKPRAPTVTSKAPRMHSGTTAASPESEGSPGE